MLAPVGGSTRTAADVLAPLQALVAPEPTATRGQVVVDTLDSPRSASLGRCVAGAAGLEDELGKQGKSGILAKRQSHAVFLGAPSHRLVVHDTPKPASWRNQSDIWCSLLVRQLLKRGSCRALEALKHTV